MVFAAIDPRIAVRGVQDGLGIIRNLLHTDIDIVVVVVAHIDPRVVLATDARTFRPVERLRGELDICVCALIPNGLDVSLAVVVAGRYIIVNVTEDRVLINPPPPRPLACALSF